jgi:hypothetical protein
MPHFYSTSQINKGKPSRSAPKLVAQHVNNSRLGLQRALSVPASAANQDMLQLQHQVGLRAIQHVLSQTEKAQPVPEAGPEGGRVNSDLQNQVAAARGGGHALDRNVGSQLGEALGTDFSRVRIHTDSKADTLNRSLAAQAFTTGSDIFFSKGAYNPATQSGKQLLTHELAHVAQQGRAANRVQTKLTIGPSGDRYEAEADRIASKAVNGAGASQTDLSVRQNLPANRISTKKSMKHLDFVRMKRSNTHIKKMLLNKLGLGKKPEDAYGHWWTEIGDLIGDNDWKPVESYGWWPSQTRMSIGKTLEGVPGVVNSTKHDGNATEDPHHGDPAKTEFHPVMEVDANADYEAVRSEVIGKIRTFVKGFKGSWNWRFGWGKNCHTFQQRLKSAVGLHYQKGNGWLKRPTEASFHQDDAVEYKAQEEDEAKERARPKNMTRIAIDYYDSNDNLLGQFPAGTILMRGLGSTEDMVEVGTDLAEFYWVKRDDLRRALEKPQPTTTPPQGETG